MLTAWLNDPSGAPLAVVTGGPGTGKSALLGCLLLAADPRMGRGVPDIAGWHNRADLPPGVFDAAIRATDLTAEKVIERFAGAADADIDIADALGLAVALQERNRPFTAVVDGVDEARTPEDAAGIAALLASLASPGDAGTACKIITSVRTGPLGSNMARIRDMLGGRALILDLSSPDLRDEDAVASYASKLLLLDPASNRSPYKGFPGAQLEDLANSIAQRSESNFLITQLTCRWLTLQAMPIRAGEIELPSTVADALDRYLNACELRTPGVRDLLRPLAFARGAGIPRNQLWVDLAQALSRGSQFTTHDLANVFHSAASYLVDRAGEDAEPTYRLFHRALDEHLRATCHSSRPHAAFTAILLKYVDEQDDRRDWLRAATYIRAHLAEHAAAAGLLDDLMMDAGFLVHSDPNALLAGLDTVTAPNAQLAAAVFRTSLHLHIKADAGTRRLTLALDGVHLFDGYQYFLISG